MQNEVELLANLIFSETKDIEDAKGIANVVIHRLKRPERFGNSLQEVIYAPSQFSGVGTDEWNKAASKKFTEKEKEFYKQAYVIASMAKRGTLEDNTNGSDHYANLKISNPRFAKVYSKRAKIGEHTYFSELPGKQSKEQGVSFSDAFSRAKESGKKEFTWNGNRYTTKSA